MQYLNDDERMALTQGLDCAYDWQTSAPKGG